MKSQEPIVLKSARGIRRLLVDWRVKLDREITVRREVWRWKKAGRPVPPPHLVKIRTVRTFAKRFSALTLVETGTYMGDMVCAVKGNFRQVFSIELDDALFLAAKDKFTGLDYVHILHGDSAAVLPGILDRISGRCLFWLDAHFSGGSTARGHVDTPIVNELQQILSCRSVDPVILIDDARLFSARSSDPILDDSWPMLADLRQIVATAYPTWAFDVQDDIVRIYKPHE